jgi:hypothetical protein
MKKSLIALLGIVLLIMPFLACVPPAASAPVSTDGFAHQSDITSLTKAIDKKADQSAVDVLTKAIGTPSSASYTKEELYTKSQVDQKIADAIAKLKTDKPWATTIANATTIDTTTSIGGYSISLDHNQVISMSSETGGKDISLTIINVSGVSTTPSLLISLIPQSPSTFEKSKLSTIHRHVKSTISGFTDSQEGTIQSNSDVTTLLSKLYWITPEFSLSNGASKSIWLNFDVWTTDTVIWTLGIKAL